MSSFTEDLQHFSDPSYVRDNPFEVLACISNYFNNEKGNEGRELLFHVMDLNVLPLEYSGLLNALIEVAGVYPYLKPIDLSSTSDLISYEAHRPENSSDIVLHSGQFEAYLHLMNGENVVLSAPTSFGKSLLIDVLIQTGKYKNIVVIVPTVALIDETRRRLQRCFGSTFRIITHATQQFADSNIFVLTQERYLELGQTPSVDLFVIDEFYKLSPDAKGNYDDRTSALNLACFKLSRQKAQFLLIGPNIENVNLGNSEIRYSFIRSEFRTVGTHVERINARGRQKDITLEICRACTDQTLIFCKSPTSAYELGGFLIDNGLSVPADKATELADWLAINYSKDWSLVRLLRAGIAIHYAALPRSISQYVLNLFNQGSIRYLLCTSTIIEGVNTSARNVIVYDNKIANKKYDFFTFSNIKGRAGRMLRHLVGRVFVLNPEPQEELPLVEIPAFSLPEGMPMSLVLEAEETGVGHLSESESRKLRYLHAQDILDYEVIKANSTFDPDAQISIAQQIRDNPSQMVSLLAWKDFPNQFQLKELLHIVFDVLLNQNSTNEVKSTNQLLFWVLQIQNNMPFGFTRFLSSVRQADQLGRHPDELLRDSLSFLRNWAEFQLPRSIQAIDRIQRSVLNELHLPTGDYSLYAERLKRLFRPPAETILEEYGVPMPLTEKIGRADPFPESVDEILQFMNNLDFRTISLSDVELDILTKAFPRDENLLPLMLSQSEV